MAQPFIATSQIFIGTALGYNPGDVVADDVVKAHKLEGSVSRKGTQAADEAMEAGGVPEVAAPQ